MSNAKNYYGENVAWFCMDASISLDDMKNTSDGTIEDCVEIYGEDENGREGSTEICIVSLLESASVVINEKDDRISQLSKERDTLITLLEGIFANSKRAGRLIPDRKLDIAGLWHIGAALTPRYYKVSAIAYLKAFDYLGTIYPHHGQTIDEFLDDHSCPTESLEKGEGDE